MRFRIQIVLRLILILVFGWAAFYFIARTSFWLLFFWFILFAILLLIDLVRYVEKSNRDLSNFLVAIQQNDFSNIYPEKKSRSKALYRAFNIITREFIKLRSEKESNFHFLKTVVEHSGVPLLAYDTRQRKITLVNEAAKELFHIPHLTKLESLSRINQELLDTVMDLKSNEKVLLKTEINGEIFHLSVLAKELVLQQERFKVLAFHNINSELDQNEIESWQKLIRVLTHEIKNSVIPISTLTEVINHMIIDEEGRPISLSDLDEEENDDLRTSLQTIEKRSKGLVRFVASYGDLAKVPRPQLEVCDVKELISQIVDLERQEAEKRGITITTDLPDREVTHLLDQQMMEQVLINLIKNAIEVLDGQKDARIILSLTKPGQSVSIRVMDNGPGMDRDTLENIFVPFYTTKEGGSGIGLSLSRQIVRAHKGNLRVSSKPGEGTVFEIMI